jgi:type IV pilus assembly protein PilC
MCAVLTYIVFLLGIVVIGGTGAYLRVRRLRIRMTVQSLASLVSQNLPLTAGLRAAAHGERGRLRRIYEQLAGRLEAGDPLSTAVRGTVPACPGEIVSALQGAERGGTLPAVLQSLAADAGRELREPDSARRPWWYLFILAVIVPLVLLLYWVVIVPKFREIFFDFGTRLPAITVTVLDVGRLVHDNAVLLCSVGFLALLGLVHLVVGRHFIVRVPGRFQVFFKLWDVLVWHLPVSRRVANTNALARQLPVLHAAVRAGHDLPEAVRQAACVTVNFHARRRLTGWALALDSGADPLDSARRAGLPAPVLWALAGLRGGGDLSVRLEYLSEYYRTLQTHWERIVLAIIGPLLVVFWGLCVGFLTVALFLPLVALLQGVMSTIY